MAFLMVMALFIFQRPVDISKQGCWRTAYNLP
jgi:hypothetical protein